METNNIPEQNAENTPAGNPVNPPYGDNNTLPNYNQTMEYYQAMKMIEEEKEAKLKAKKKKKRIGCGIVLLIPILIIIISAIGNSLGKEKMSEEPVTCLDIRKVWMDADKNGVDNSAEKFEQHENGYKYRYNCIAKYNSMELEDNVYLVLIPYPDDSGNFSAEKGLNARLEIPEDMKTDFESTSDTWFLLENVCIDIYVSNSGIAIKPVIDSESSIKVVYSENEAVAWLDKNTEK